MNKTGLALGGGAILGAAHIGTLRALKELEIDVHYISGTSIGALIAAFYAFGKSWEDIQTIAMELKWMDVSRISLSLYGLLSNVKLGELIIKHLGDQRIEDAQIPLAIIATDISTGEKVVLREGNVAKAIMGSTCIPGVFKPVEVNGKMLVDGGIVENIPVETVKSLGADFIIGIDLNAKHQYKRPNNILDVIINSFHLLIQNSDKIQTEACHLLVQPNLSQFNRSDTKQVKALIEQGYKDSKSQIEFHKEQSKKS